MFATLGLFTRLPCPERPQCGRSNCIFSHDPTVTQPPTAHIPVEVPKLAPAPTPEPVASTSKVVSSVPAKRANGSPYRVSSSRNDTSMGEPPRKLQRIGPPQRSTAVPTATQATTGVPVLRVNAAQSKIAIPTRQAMIKSLFDHFQVLYESILPTNPYLASEHALKQEQEVYDRTTKLTYRNAVINSIAALKQRPRPDSFSHPSVGTDGDIKARKEAQKELDSLRLTLNQLEPYVLTIDEMKQWEYIVEIPSGVGGDQPSEEGSIQKCQRCNQPFKVKRMEEADECVFHWGRRYTTKTNGEKRRVFTCCYRSTDDEGCDRGPHVFYESEPKTLHNRHAFSYTRAANDGPDTALDIVALDCEMIYSTGGMRVARVSVVDSTGKEVFDEFVKMDEGVEVIDFNTRFSGITPELYATALLPLTSIRKSLDSLINSDTIIIGHALENDLKTLRMIHHRCIDTAVVFPHKMGPPIRRALRDLVKEHLGKTIQTGGGTVGHSSVEDSIATLDLVRWHVLNKPGPPKPKLPPKLLVENPAL